MELHAILRTNVFVLFGPAGLGKTPTRRTKCGGSHLEAQEVVVVLLIPVHSVAFGKASKTLQRSRFHYGEVARAKFLQSKILRELSQIKAAECALQDSIEIMRQLVRNDTRPIEGLNEPSYDELVVIWRR